LGELFKGLLSNISKKGPKFSFLFYLKVNFLKFRAKISFGILTPILEHCFSLLLRGGTAGSPSGGPCPGQ